MGHQRFLWRNIFKGLAWLAIILIAYIVSKKYIGINYIQWLEPVYSNTGLMYVIFLLSEVVIGIIPPELFIIWALQSGDLPYYIMQVGVLAIASYLAGLTGYYIGRYLNQTKIYRYLRRRFLSRTESRLNEFGIYLIIIAALTPLPFSGVAMLVGSVGYSLRKYLLLSMFRFVRFAVYAVVIWETQMFL